MEALHTLLLLLIGWVAVLQSSVTAQEWRSPPDTPMPKGGEQLDTHHSVLPLVKFVCKGRSEGYYGDMDFGCIIFHYCDKEGQRFSFKCDEGMKFNEVTTSCSAAYFGDCSHSQIVGSTGRDKSTKSIGTDSTVKVPGFIAQAERDGLKEQERNEQPPIHPEGRSLVSDSYHQHHDVNDQKADASDKVYGNTIKRSPSTQDSPMMSALSSFASLVNIPLDNSMLGDHQRESRGRVLDNVDRFDTIDRSFVAHQSPHIRTPHKQANMGLGFLQLPFFQPETKEGRVSPHRVPPRSQNIIKFHRRRPHPRPDAQDPYIDPPPRFQRPPRPFENNEKFDPFNDDHYETGLQKPFFRPSSMLNIGEKDEFQPVTKSEHTAEEVRETTDLARPNREAQGGAISTTFQNFPRPSPQSSSTGFPAQNTFRPTSLSRPNQGVQPGFNAGSHFPSTGSFLFHQPAVPSVISSKPFHHVLSPGTGFRGTSAPSLQTQGSFGFVPRPQHHPQPGQTIVRQTLPNHGQTFVRQPQLQPQISPSFSHSPTQTFGQPVEPRPLRTFEFPRTKHPQKPHSVFKPDFTTQPTVFRADNTPPPTTPQPVHTFEHPATPPEPFNVFNLAEVPLAETDSFDQSPPRPPPVFQLETQSPDTFRISSPTPLTDTALESADDFAFGDPDPEQENPTDQKGTRQQQRRPPPPIRRPSKPSTFQEHHPHHPSPTFHEPSRTPENLDQVDAFGLPLEDIARDRPVGRPVENQGDDLGNKPLISETEESVRRRPIRPRRPTRPLDRTSHIPQRGEHQPFSQSDDELLQVPRLQPQPIPHLIERDPFVNPRPFNPLPQDQFGPLPGAFDHHQQEGHFQHSPDVFNFPTRPGSVPGSSQHVGNDIHPSFGFSRDTKRVKADEVSTVEATEEDTNIIQPTGDDIQVAEEVSAPTPSLISNSTTNTQSNRRRPSIRTRLRQRGSSLTTTSPPEIFPSNNSFQNNDELSDDSLITTQVPDTKENTNTTTTLSPFRQRQRDRLNRLKNRRRLASRTTTVQPSLKQIPSRATSRQPTNNQRDSDRFTTPQPNTDDKQDTDQTSTTVSPRRRLLRPLGFDSKRFQSFREKLRSRSRSRLTTTEAPQAEEDTTTIPAPPEEEVSATGERTSRFNRFRPKLSESNTESVLVVEEILRSSDQDVQETTQVEVSKNPEVEQMQEHHEGDSPDLEKTFGDKEAVTETNPDTQEEGDGSQVRSLRGDTPRRIGFQGRRLANPELRARFRAFLMNRKNKLNSRLPSSETPSLSKDMSQPKDHKDEQVPEDTEGDPEHHADEKLSVKVPALQPYQREEERQRQEESDDAILRERAERFEQRRKELRTKLLARRNEERLSREIPVRSFKNHVSSETMRKGVEQITPSEDKPESEEDPPAVRDETKPIESPLQKVISIDGFKPIIETPPAPPTPLHPRPNQEPEIITAPSPSEEDGEVILVNVSTDFGGKEKQRESTKLLSNSDPSPPSPMIVSEKDTVRSTSTKPQTQTQETVTQVSRKEDTIEHFEEYQQGSESQYAPVLLSVQTVPEKAPLYPHGILPLNSLTQTTEEPSSISPSLMTEAPTRSSPDVAQTKHVSRPSFNLGTALARRSSQIKGEKREESTGGAGVSITPLPQFAITMATGAPLLPLEMLLPLDDSR